MFNFLSCSKSYNYNACFITSKDTFTVGEVVTFTNCSKFDGGTELCYWDFAEGTPSKMNSNGLAPINYTFTTTGTKIVLLIIGEKECGSDTSKKIFIK